MKFPVITIDGPSGSGKGTVCLQLAKMLNYRLLDSGALYRIVGLKAFEAGFLDNSLNFANDELGQDIENAIANLTESLSIEFLPTDSGHVNIVVDGDNVSSEIRNETVGGYASQVAALPKVRAALLQLQKDMAEKSGLVADGRDMGTVVFPDADVKIYLTASAEARATRRISQLSEAGDKADYDTILSSIKLRDERDESRSASPSKPAQDALIIDSSNLDPKTVLDKVVAYCKRQGISF